MKGFGFRQGSASRVANVHQAIGGTNEYFNEKQVAQEVNAWVRMHDKRLGAPEPSFDAVVDLESVVKDPNDPEWAMNPLLAAPDRVHPNQAGYTAIANAFPLDVFHDDQQDHGPRSEDCHHDR